MKENTSNWHCPVALLPTILKYFKTLPLLVKAKTESVVLTYLIVTPVNSLSVLGWQGTENLLWSFFWLWVLDMHPQWLFTAYKANSISHSKDWATIPTICHSGKGRAIESGCQDFRGMEGRMTRWSMGFGRGGELILFHTVMMDT